MMSYWASSRMRSRPKVLKHLQSTLVQHGEIEQQGWLQERNNAMDAPLLHGLTSKNAMIVDFMKPTALSSSLSQRVLSEPLDVLRRNTFGISVDCAKAKLNIITFVDGGADVNVGGRGIFDVFREFELKGSNRSMTLVPAGKADALVSRKRLRMKIMVRDYVYGVGI